MARHFIEADHEAALELRVRIGHLASDPSGPFHRKDR